MNPHIGMSKEEYVEKNKRLVHSVCQRYVARGKKLGLEYDDLVSYGIMGLLKSYDRYDPSKFNGTVNSITTYAVPMIKGEIGRWLRDLNPSGVKFSRQVKELSYVMYKEDLIDGKPEEIAKRLNVSEERAILAKKYIEHGKTKSIDEEVFNNDGDSVTFADQQGAEDDQTSIFVEEFKEFLPNHLREILELKMRGLTQQQIGDEVGVSQVQVSRFLIKIGEILNKYQKGEEEMMKKAQGNMEVAKRLIKETDLTPAEIATRTGCNLNTMKMYAHRYRKKDEKKEAPTTEVKGTTVTESQEELVVQLKPQYTNTLLILKDILNGKEVSIRDEEIKNKIEGAFNSLGVHCKTKVKQEWVISLADSVLIS